MPRTITQPPAYSEAGPSRHPDALRESAASPPDLPPATQALIALTQDVSALLSLSIEATASLVHDWFRSSLCRIGFGTTAPPLRTRDQKYGKGEIGRGLAVVVIGAAEHTGQSLSLQLARSGYTVFPFLPLPSPLSSPTSSALSSLLLAWSNIQRRLRQRYPHHPGSIVPIIIDPEPNSPQWVKQLKGKDRFRHAGDTVRAYIRENDLDLVAVLCATQMDPKSGGGADGYGREDMRWSYGSEHDQYGSPGTDALSLSILPSPLPPSPPSLPSIDRDMLESITPPEMDRVEIALPRRGLLSADESTLLGLYRANVLDPLTAVRELRDLLVATPKRVRNARLVFVNAQSLAGAGSTGREGVDDTVLQVITAARSETIRLLRYDMAEEGVEVCEVIAGPLHEVARKRLTHARSNSDESGSTVMSGRPVLRSSAQVANQLVQVTNTGGLTSPRADMDAQAMTTLEHRFQTLTRLWAVDDALLYSSVRRAMEDQYPRQRHHAGLSPLVESVVDMIPGARFGKMLGSRTGPLKVKRRQGAVGQTAPECEAIAVVWLDSVGYEVKETGGASMEAQDSDSDGV